MTRKNESLLNLLLILPWWISVVLAFISYGILKYILPGMPFNSALIRAFIIGISHLAPFFAIILLITACISASYSWKKRRMLDEQKGLNTINDLNWKEFEELVGEAYRRQGYFVLENPCGGSDGGVDLRLRKDGKVTLVQCKHWKTQRVNAKIVRELYGVMVSRKANRGIVVTFGSFTQDAKDFAKDKPLDLVHGQDLMALIGRVQRSRIIDQGIHTTTQKNYQNNKEGSLIKKCPLCGSEMVLRKATNGKHAGQQFWGCKSFPKCRGILSL